MKELLTEEELREAQRSVRAGVDVLGLPFVRVLRGCTGPHDLRTVLDEFIAFAFKMMLGKMEENKANPVFHSPERVREFWRAFRLLGEQMEVNRFSDLLGMVHQELRGARSSQGSGAFYTPENVCRMMAGVLEGEALRAKLERGEVVRVCDPSVGAGRTLMAFAAKYRDYLDQIRFLGTDIELPACQMCFVNWTLNGMAGCVRHGNELSQEVWGEFVTMEWPLYEQSAAVRRMARRMAEVLQGMEARPDAECALPQVEPVAAVTPVTVETGGGGLKQLFLNI